MNGRGVDFPLQSQESKYNAKVDAVKAEHEQLLQEAFEKAKVGQGTYGVYLNETNSILLRTKLAMPTV